MLSYQMTYNDTNFKDCREHEKEYNSRQTKKVSPYVQILILYNVISYINNNSCYYSSLCLKKTKLTKNWKKVPTGWKIIFVSFVVTKFVTNTWLSVIVNHNSISSFKFTVKIVYPCLSEIQKFTNSRKSLVIAVVSDRLENNIR